MKRSICLFMCVILFVGMCQIVVSAEEDSCNGRHSFDSLSVKTVSPTCTEDGYTVVTCKECGQTFKCNIVKALGHHYKSKDILKVTAFHHGIDKVYCTRCGDIISCGESEIKMRIDNYTKIKVKRSKDKIKLTWKKVLGATKYIVQIKKKNKWKTVQKSLKRSYVEYNINDKKYSFRVRACENYKKIYNKLWRDELLNCGENSLDNVITLSDGTKFVLSDSFDYILTLGTKVNKKDKYYYGKYVKVVA